MCLSNNTKSEKTLCENLLFTVWKIAEIQGGATDCIFNKRHVNQIWDFSPGRGGAKQYMDLHWEVT